MSAVGNKPVVYVEDEPNDAFLMRIVLEKSGVDHPLIILENGQAAIDYFAGLGSEEVPCLLLLDLNLPRRSGLEVLQWLRKQPRFVRLPVVVFTSSEHERDRMRAQELGANDYIVKTASLEQLTSLVKMFHERWLKSCAADSAA